MTSPEIGQRVVRSSEWSWRDQDGGEGHLGTVVKMTDQEAPLHGWTRVRWDNGRCNKYRVGTGGTYDLLLFDSAPAGVVHSKITCSNCEVDSIHGIRWKCCDHSCTDVNLCTPCYMTDKHDLTHRFTRFNSQNETGIVVTSRSEEEKTTSMGLCPEAQVSRGEDWQGEESDGQEGNVVEGCAISGRPRSGVAVKWIDTGQTTTHRVGHDGKVDLKYTKPGRGIDFYASHLPFLGKEQGVKVGDRVAMTLAAKRLQVIQESNGCKWSPRMHNLITKVAVVTGINSNGNVEISYPGRDDHFILHPDALNKVPIFEKGDRVGVQTNKEYVKELQENSKNGWADGMEKCLDKEGTVLLVDEHFDTWVRFESLTPDSWWHPCALTLVEKKPHHLGDGAKSTHIKSETTGLPNDGNSIESQLYNAAKTGDHDRVLEILSSSPENVNGKVNDKSALHKASARGHLKVVKALIEAGADIEITTDDGHTPLHYAVDGDEPAVVKYLIEKGADIDRGSTRQRRAIHRAAYGNFVDCARILINHGCDVNVQDREKDTPLHEAIITNSIDVAELLLAVPKLDTTLTNKRNMPPILFASLKDRPEIVRMVARHCPSSIAVPKQHGYNVLHIAAVNNHVEVMKILLAIEDHGLCIETKNSEGQTALHLASYKAYSESIEYLISLGADINSQCHKGHSPLHLVASRTRKPTEIKETPVLKRIRKKYRDRGVGGNTGAALLCFMVLHGASIDSENESCRTPLYYIDDPKLKRTLKEIARGDREVDLKSLEDMVGDEASETEDLTTNAIYDDDDDIHIPQTPVDDPAANDQGSENLARTNKPKTGLFELVHEIKVSDIKMGSVVGTGQFGVVHRATWRGTTVAVKKISTIGSKKDEVEKEVSIHRQATHPNIVKMMALGYECTDAYLVMEFIEGPSLEKIIFPDRDDRKIHLDWSAKLGISREVLQAVTFMHASNILHLDIKPANILLESATNRPFICDMGLAHIKNRNAMTQSTMHIRGTPQFMPPEVITAVAGYKHSSKHDIWSVAGTLVELYSMKRLWGDLSSPVALLARFMAGGMCKPEALEFVDPKIQEILGPCFNEKPQNRPSAEELQNKFNDLS
ncbi:E3 ubiquitin-protein ligase MIB2-like isoform X2 [Lytechinus variegatus]|uniref:E3 ubiquitin-protein ligase MIB2-like isoform X2 n=1 Tax=Lytechinus variegatus TaxID=7654 RepID=UPI001BB24C89|nr:E3 ubiquitin-protein ligase MIB2-like isoform X2 [Lytechinus variegatus]